MRTLKLNWHSNQQEEIYIITNRDGIFSITFLLDLSNCITIRPPNIMRCRIKSLVYLVFSLGFASSLVLMVYKVTHSDMQLLRNASSLLNETHPDDSIPLMNFNDLGSGKERVLLLVVANSAPHKSDRRLAIRSTWWRHCTENHVSKIIFRAC